LANRLRIAGDDLLSVKVRNATLEKEIMDLKAGPRGAEMRNPEAI
jgi:hypothetical protein